MHRHLAMPLVSSIGAVLMLFGFGYLNYTKARGLEHHREFAREHGLPEPSESILFGGAATLALGAGMVGYSFGSRNCSKPKASA